VHDTPITQAPTPESTTKPANNVAPKEARKILLYMIIVFIVVLLIVMFIVLISFVHNSSSSSSDQPHAIVTQVCNCQAPILFYGMGL
jgi:flagellar basal body-associated protein FliL